MSKFYNKSLIKAAVLITLSLLPGTKAISQSIKNASFDSAYVGGIDRLPDWIPSDVWVMSANGDTIKPETPNTHYIATGLQYHELLKTVSLYSSPGTGTVGTQAIELRTLANCVYPGGARFPGFVVNGNHFYINSAGYLDLIKCGEPFPHRPTALKGYYKFSSQGVDYGKATVILKKYNSLLNRQDTVGIGQSQQVLGAQAAWTQFSIPITYFSQQLPDSIIVIFYASTNNNVSTLNLDGLNFSYATVGLTESSSTAEFAVYPSYASDRVLLKVPANSGDYEAELHDINGKLLDVVRNAQSLDVSALPPGVYFVHFSAGALVCDRRLVIVR